MIQWILVFMLCSCKCDESKIVPDVRHQQKVWFFSTETKAKESKADLESGIGLDNDKEFICGEVKIYKAEVLK